MSFHLHCLLPLTVFVFLFSPAYSFGTGAFSKHIKIDQFGYLLNSKKVTVIVDPQTGYKKQGLGRGFIN